MAGATTGVDLFAPTRLYGAPDDFRAFVDRAHQRGLAVILDVVYNHFGPTDNYVGAYSRDFFAHHHRTDCLSRTNLSRIRPVLAARPGGPRSLERRIWRLLDRGIPEGDSARPRCWINPHRSDPPNADLCRAANGFRHTDSDSGNAGCDVRLPEGADLRQELFVLPTGVDSKGRFWLPPKQPTSRSRGNSVVNFR